MNTSHLTPEKLLGNNVLPPEWDKAQVAFICFTPFPNGFKPYIKETAQDRYFLHSPNSEVRLCRFQDIPFLVISEVYGFAVGATTVEELVHHGVKTIIAVGYAGAFNNALVGQPFVAANTMSDLPLAAHYGIHEYERCQPSVGLLNVLDTCIKGDANQWGHFTV